MSPLTVALLAFSMSLDAFAVAAGKGTKLRHPHWGDALRTGAIFGVIEAITPLIGWALGIVASRYIEAIDHWFAFLILGGLGVKMVYEGIYPAAEEPHEPPQKNKKRFLVLAAVGSSLDAMAVGVTLAFVDANIAIVAAAIGFATFIMATVGIMFGRYVGDRFGHIAEAVGGVVLIIIGTSILLEHTGLI